MELKRYKPLLVLVVIYIVGLFGVLVSDMTEEAQLQQVETLVLEVSDKPYIPAEEAQVEVEEWEAEQEAIAEQYVYYAPSYYDPTYDDMSDKDYIAWRESGADYEARNGRYYGKYQMDESRLDGDYSPEHQEEVAEQYMLDRYGSWEAAREFWDNHGWW